MSDWIKLHRSLNDNPLWLLEPFTKAQAWVDLCLNANWKKGSFSVRGNIVDIERGQLGWSELTMAGRWKWSREKVRRYLSYLEKSGNIRQQKTHITSIVTICNYETYQGDDTTDKTTDKTTDETTEKQQKNNRRDTIEEGKEGEEGKESLREECPEKKTSKLPNAFHSSPHKDEAVNFAKWFRDNLAPQSITVTDKILDDWAYQWYLLRAVDKRSDVKEVCAAIQWARGDPFWSNNFLTPMKLRTKDKNGVMFIDRFISEKNKIKHNGKQPEDYSWLMQWIADNPDLK